MLPTAPCARRSQASHQDTVAVLQLYIAAAAAQLPREEVACPAGRPVRPEKWDGKFLTFELPMQRNNTHVQ